MHHVREPVRDKGDEQRWIVRGREALLLAKGELPSGTSLP